MGSGGLGSEAEVCEGREKTLSWRCERCEERGIVHVVTFTRALDFKMGIYRKQKCNGNVFIKPFW